MTTFDTAALVARLPGALDRRDRREVNALVKALVDRRAQLGRQWRSLALVMTRNGEHRTAIAAMGLYADAEGTPQARLEQVLTLHNGGRVEQARSLLATLPPSVGAPGTWAYLLGSLESMAGAREPAREHLWQAVRETPDNGQAWLGLAMLDRADAAEDIAAAVIAHDPRRTGAAMRNADAFFHALGKVHDERGDRAEAFAAFAHGASVAAAHQPYDAAGEAGRARAVVASFDRDAIDRIAAAVSVDTNRPIFVTGNPRSGTTLVEHILTSHSAVGAGGELDIMRVVGQEIGGPMAADLERYVGRRSADDLALLYDHLLDERFDEPGRVVDKRLLASRTLGLIASVLPKAPIIWMRRDPLDCAWSCFRTYFNQSSAWSHRLETIAHHFKLEDELLAVWRERLGDRLLVLSYEQLVTDPETEIRRILAHCGLDEEAGVFTPHENDRAVMTASVMQVRNPISRAGIGVAEPYRGFMQPFIDAYYG